MERIEYSKVKTLAQTPFERYMSEEEISFWRDTSAYYSGYGIAKIEGAIPKDFQEYIQTKYLDGKLGIIKEKNENSEKNTVYKIMSKEGLLAILLEIQDYFDRKFKKKEMVW